ncbi:MAG: recombinase RecQ, partial [Spirulinaceae cyanobacterium RM2_2_10]|nr:recombinase RecQ [Spirulinaceae cyanobacterium RM2_2_10]
ALVSERSGWHPIPERPPTTTIFQQQRQQHYEQAARLVKALPRAGEVMAIAQQFPQGAITLSLLHSAGLLEWRDPFHYRRLDEGNAAAALRSLCTAQTQRDQATQRYWTTRQCRWQVLLDAFGFRREAAGFRCGHCDNCLRSSS